MKNKPAVVVPAKQKNHKKIDRLRKQFESEINQTKKIKLALKIYRYFHEESK